MAKYRRNDLGSSEVEAVETIISERYNEAVNEANRQRREAEEWLNKRQQRRTQSFLKRIFLPGT